MKNESMCQKLTDGQSGRQQQENDQRYKNEIFWLNVAEI